MDYGLYISASGAFSAMYRQDVFANNLANMDTVGFKADLPATRQRLPAREEDGLLNRASDDLLERLGAGVLLAPNRTSLAQGALRTTGAPLDLAIQGDGFFVVRDPSDTTGDPRRLTRDGRFLRNAQGLLVNASGLPVLDDQDSPITLPPSGRVTIDERGVIRTERGSVARLRMISVADPALLRKRGQSLFQADESAFGASPGATGIVRQGHLEDSTVDEVSTLMRVTSASRDAESNFNMIAQADRLTDRLINTFGRVS